MYVIYLMDNYFLFFYVHLNTDLFWLGVILNELIIVQGWSYN